MAVRYDTLRICVLRTSHLEPYRTSVPYFSSIFEAYHTNYVPYRNAILAFHTFSIGFSCLLPLHTKSRRNVQKVWDFSFKQRTNVPYLYLYKKGVPYQRTVLLCKNWSVPYRTAILAEQNRIYLYKGVYITKKLKAVNHPANSSGLQ